MELTTRSMGTRKTTGSFTISLRLFTLITASLSSILNVSFSSPISQHVRPGPQLPGAKTAGTPKTYTCSPGQSTGSRLRRCRDRASPQYARRRRRRICNTPKRETARRVAKVETHFRRNAGQSRMSGVKEAEPAFENSLLAPSKSIDEADKSTATRRENSIGTRARKEG
ncbi:hypothetical protein C8R45DRAFT_972714 [Mycena sanguinolenta]|nr:hypothetical protein C8R45DRAFT_972714 [Mycena sanguinolenta]